MGRKEKQYVDLQAIAKKEEEELELAKHELEEIIPSYKQHKAELKAMTDETEEENSNIKRLMGRLKVSNFIVGGLIAKITTTHKESFDEALLLERLKSMKVPGIIKTKEYVDMDALENAIYNKQIDAASLKSCKVESSFDVLRVLVNKKGSKE